MGLGSVAEETDKKGAGWGMQRRRINAFLTERVLARLPMTRIDVEGPGFGNRPVPCSEVFFQI